MELRAKIVEAIDSSWTEADDLDPFAAADSILQIPEIKEALEAQARRNAGVVSVYVHPELKA